MIAGKIIPDSGKFRNEVEKPDDKILFDGGDGSNDDPYRISNIRQLNNINLYPESNYILINDIDLSETEWIPISSFNGSFDGNGRTLSGLHLSEDRFYYSGLFGVLGKDSVIKDMIFRDVNLTGIQYAGTLAGLNTGKVIRCRVTGNITGSECGGVVAVNEKSGSVSLCSFSGTCESRFSNAGGIAGINTGTINDCLSEGFFSVKKDNAGGISGFNTGTINRCFSTGRMLADNANAGGISGANSGLISECVVYKVTVSSVKYDVLAVNYAGVTRNCGVLGKKNLGNADQSFFSSWDFETIWIMTGNGPVIRSSN